MQEGRDQAIQKQQRDSRKTVKKLRAEVCRKDKALAETTSLLVLQKKLEAFYCNGSMISNTNVSDNIAAISKVLKDQKTTLLFSRIQA